MHKLIHTLRYTFSAVFGRGIVLVLGCALGYALGYRDADAGEPSLYSRAQSLVGVDHVRDDHMRRQRAIDAIKQARLDSLEAMIPH